MAESSFRQAMLVSQGNVGIFWSNPLVATIVTLALLMLFWPILSGLWGKVGGRPAAGVSPGQ
jgi:putative tricarboxylic transport membrane protein